MTSINRILEGEFDKRFSFDTITNFDDHISKSILAYDVLAEIVCRLSTFLIQPDTTVVDLGCSTGKLLEAIPTNNPKIGIDIASNLLPQSHGNVRYLKQDIREAHYFGASLILSIFTLQFLPIKHRETVLRNTYKSLVEGGGFIWAEKTQQTHGNYEQILSMAHYDYKRQHFTAEEILDKEQNLRPIMKPLTSEQNQQLAQNAGFTSGTMVWKTYNFEAWLYIK